MFSFVKSSTVLFIFYLTVSINFSFFVVFLFWWSVALRLRCFFFSVVR